MMTQEDQEKLFAQVRERWPDWPIVQASGYVHGVNDAKRGMDKPQAEYQRAYKRGTHDYANGYMIGFIGEYGPDAREMEWAQDMLGICPGWSSETS